MTKRILLISYYWPPAGGGGVQRWLKMSKYLPEMKYDLLVYTPENGEAPVVDNSLINEINPQIKTLKTPIWEPYNFYKKFSGRKKDEKVYSGFISDKDETWMQKLSVFIRGNFFIPDARKFWIKPSIKFLVKYLKTNPVDVIISTGPPHSMHLIALGVKQKIDVKWIADFRDPWTNIDFYDQLRLTNWADKNHHRLEKKVLKNATKVVTVSKSWAKEFEILSGRKDIQIITNGFDKADFKDVVKQPPIQFTLCHIGSMNKDRNPGKLWKALATLKKEKILTDFKIKLIGQVDHQIFVSIDKCDLTQHIEHLAFMPHEQVIQEIMRSTVLLLPINDTPNSAGVIPGKLFEYMGSGIPVLGIGPTEGDSAQILIDANAGVMLDYNDLSGMVQAIKAWIDQPLEAKSETNNGSQIDKYSRENLAKEYDRLIKSILFN